MNCYFESLKGRHMKIFLNLLEEYKETLKQKKLDDYQDLFLNTFLPNYKDQIPKEKYHRLMNCPAKKFAKAKNHETIPFLENMKIHTMKNVYAFVPSLYINDNLVRGADEGDIAASAVCDSFKEQPYSCRSLSVKLKNLEVVDTKNVHNKALLIIVFSVLIIFGCVFLLYKKIMVDTIDRDMNEMVNYHLERYQKI
jgi:hypothetical protein